MKGRGLKSHSPLLCFLWISHCSIQLEICKCHYYILIIYEYVDIGQQGWYICTTKKLKKWFSKWISELKYPYMSFAWALCFKIMLNLNTEHEKTIRCAGLHTIGSFVFSQCSDDVWLHFTQGVGAQKCRKIAFILEKEVKDFIVTTFQLAALFMKRN